MLLEHVLQLLQLFVCEDRPRLPGLLPTTHEAVTPSSTTTPVRLAATPVRAVVVARSDCPRACTVPSGVLFIVVSIVAGLASSGD